MATIVLSPHTLAKDRSDIKAEVESSNTVGYTKVNLIAGYNIVGQSFAKVSGGATSIQNVLVDGLDGDGNDTMRIWDGSKYDTYYYYSAEALESDKGGWGDPDGELYDGENDVIEPGTGFWILSSNIATVTILGQVPATTEVTLSQGYNLVCAPQPVELDIQDIEAEGLDGDGNDTMRIWDGSKYDTYYYYSAEALESDKGGWGDADGELQTVSIPAGSGFWVISSGAATLSFPDAL